MSDWVYQPLEHLADIRSSNVDKKTNLGEQSVRLCNYMDVYSREYIDGTIEFMEATATAAEVQRFGVERGDVMITKDSETPNDIGIPAVVCDDIPNLVCGYHLALIKPNRDLVDPVYLAKQLGSEQTTRYFGRLANGSTRYGLTYRSIASTPVRLAPLPQQQRIAEILSTVDEAIEQTEALIAKAQQIKSGLMHDLFTRGITPDGQLRPSREDAPQLYKESPLGWIPKDWDWRPLGECIGQIDSGWSPNCEATSVDLGREWGILKTTAVVWTGYDPRENKKLFASSIPMGSVEVKQDDLLITRKGPVDRVGVAVHVSETPSKLMFPDTVFRARVIDSEEMMPAFSALAMGSHAVQKHWWQRKVGLAEAQVNLNHGILRSTPMPVPTPKEQSVLCDISVSSGSRIKVLQLDVQKLSHLKRSLMADLLCGHVQIPIPDSIQEAC